MARLHSCDARDRAKEKGPREDRPTCQKKKGTCMHISKDVLIVCEDVCGIVV
jgi:hypothetical protein